MSSDLLAALERAEIGDRELNAQMAVYAGVRFRSRRSAGGVNRGREWFEDSHGGVETWSQQPPAYTTSLDAIVSLIERELPGWDWSVHRHKQGSEPSHRDAWAGLRAPPKGIVSGILHEANGYTPALALCIAFVKAKEAAKQNEESA